MHRRPVGHDEPPPALSDGLPQRESQRQRGGSARARHRATGVSSFAFNSARSGEPAGFSDSLRSPPMSTTTTTDGGSVRGSDFGASSTTALVEEEAAAGHSAEGASTPRMHTPASPGTPGHQTPTPTTTARPDSGGPVMPSSHPQQQQQQQQPNSLSRSGYGASPTTPDGSAEQQSRPPRTPGGSHFPSAGGAVPSLPPPPPLTSRAAASQPPPPPPSQQQQQQQPWERRVHYGTQRANPPVCASSTTSSRDWVRLNVGGRVFISTFATLCSDPNSVLTQICEPLLASRRRAEGEKEQDHTQGAGEPQQLRRRQPPPHHHNHHHHHHQTPSPTQQGDNASLVTIPSVAGGGAAGESSQKDGAPLRVSPPSPTGDDGADPLPERRQSSLSSHADPYTGVARRASPPPSSSPGGGDAGGGELPNPRITDSTAYAPLDVDEHNSILLDLDPDYFTPILNYLRHRTVVIPPNLSASGVLAVAEYLNVQGMVRQLAPERRVKRQVLSSWGSGGSGELGTQRFLDNNVPTPVQVTPFGVKVVHMALGANYSCALSDDGNIYTFGNGDWGQLGLGPPRSLDVHPKDRSAVVVVPQRIPLFEKHSALHVSAGYAFAMAIIKDYRVYFWGNNNHGQSGLGPRFFDYNTRKVDEPKLVDTLEGKRIVQLGCGSFFSLALSEDGTLYSWGLVECLGLGTPDEVRRMYQGTGVLGESLSNEKRGVVLTPQVVNIRSSGNHRIVRIHAGQWHSGAINSAGELFTWGVGYQGRLGHGTKEPAYVPTKVRGALTGHRVVDVACGSFHTVALTDRGAVFCWGDNASGQCGTSATHAEAVTSPYRVVGLEFIAGGVAKGISCGRQHTVVVMEGPQPDCRGPCCQLDYRGRPYHAHAQVYTFGEGARGTAVGGAVSATTAAAGTGNTAGAGHGGTAGSGGNGHVGAGGGAGNASLDAYEGGGMGAAGRTCSQYQFVPGLERMNVVGVVSGLHHTFVYAEEIDCGPPVPGGSGAHGEETKLPPGGSFYGAPIGLHMPGAGYGACGGFGAGLVGGSGGSGEAQRQWQ